MKTNFTTKTFPAMPKCSHAESTLRVSLVLAGMGKRVLLACADERRAKLDESRLRELATESMYRDSFKIERQGLKLKIERAA